VTGTELLELGGIVIGLALLARLAGHVGIPAVPLYLLGGLAFGRGGLLPLVHSGGFIRTGAEIGLILLLFMLGLEYSARELVDGLRRTWWAAVVDVVLSEERPDRRGHVQRLARAGDHQRQAEDGQNQRFVRPAAEAGAVRRARQ
jgi:sodium/hydrogen exchanger family protein